MWGDQTWEEMAVVFFEVAEARNQTTDTDATVPDANSPPLLDAAGEADVQNFLARFDANGDRVVARLETPLSFRRFGFYRYDADGDERLTEAEIRAAVASSKR